MKQFFPSMPGSETPPDSGHPPDSGAFKIGKITVSGQITEYSTRINAGVFDPEDYAPSQIVTGPDGNPWFTNSQLGRQGMSIVGKVTPSGLVKIYYTGDVPIAITSGPDGNLWVTEKEGRYPNG
jgi:virginiamycin B lyase